MAEIGISIAAKIAEYLVEPTLRQLRYMFWFNNIVKDLIQENEKLTLALEQVQIDVEKARGNAEEIRKYVEKWLTDSNSAIEDVKSFENEAQDNKSCLNGWCPNWCGRYRLSRNAAKKKLGIIELIKLEKDGKFRPVGDPAALPNAGFLSSKDYLSSKARESATNQIMEALKDDKVNMIGLHGMGGVGKTTLVKELGGRVSKATLVKELGGRANDLNLFDVVVIAAVSQTPNVKNIQQQIAESLRLKFDEDTEEARATRLWAKLKSVNKILIILDDVWVVWDHLKLTDIGIPFGNDHKGCKILLTTRSRHVCTAMESQKIIKLDVLLEDEEWALFKKNAGLGSDSTLITVASEVARECKGLPLAVVTVGSALRGKSLDEYKVALKKLKDSKFVDIQAADKDVYACLRLSYDYLKGKEIRSCFLLCSLFPEDYKINIEDLARIGWGIGLFQEGDAIDDARTEMGVMMKKLQDSGLLIDTDEDQFVKMHDMVRDVALWIASEGENVFMVRTGAALETWPHDRSLEPYTAISLMANRIKELPNGLVCPNLNTLLLGGDGVSMTISDVFFEEMKALKVLSVVQGILVPQSLQFLINLQTLHLDYCKFNDISSLGKLKKLGILRLCRSNIVELPNEIGELSNLRLLDVNGCRKLERIPPFVISKLSKLEELYIEFSTYRRDHVYVKLACDRLWELNSLSHLAVLSLQFDVKCLPIDFAFPKLTRSNINMLNFKMEYPTSKTLGIKDVDATSLNAFKELFPAVEYLDLRSAVGFQNIIPNMEQGGLNNLISLHLDSCREMECLIDSTQQQQVTTQIAFSNLVKLSLEGMTHLREICYGNRPPEGFLQKLKTLKVTSCLNVFSIFPKQLSERLQNLENVTVRKCEKVQEVFGLEGPTHGVAEGNHVMLLSNLTSLDLNSLPELKCIWKGPTQHVSLQSLRDVKVYGCERLTYLFSSSLARSLVQLQRLTIWSCKGLEQIIMTEKEDGEISSETNPQLFCFPKLTTLKIGDCKKLEYIFSISVALDLRLLEELSICDAPELMQIFGHAREEDLVVGDGNDFVLPKLRELKLVRLSSLTSFSEGNYHWVWPSLQELIVVKCPKMKASFISDLASVQKQLRVLIIDNHNLSHEAIILQQRQGLQKLEELRIENCEEVQEVFHCISTDKYSNLEQLNLKDLPELRVIWKGPTQKSSFQNLTHIDVINCNKLIHVFSPSVARNLSQLRSLEINGCEELERIIGEENKDEEDQIISSKGHLQQPICFPNLKAIEVKDCNKLRSLFPITIAGGLSQLKVLSVQGASQFEEVFRHENEEDVRDEKNIVLPELYHLSLKDLPRLISFCPGGYHFIFPSLGYLKVEGCLNITMRFTNDSDRSVHAKAEVQVFELEVAEGDHMMPLSNLTWLDLDELPELKCIWKKPTRHVSLQSLQNVKVWGCERLTYLFSSSLARSLVQLQRLTIFRCPGLEQIIVTEKEDGEISSETHLQPLCFPQLTTFRIENCEKLEYIFPIAVAQDLQLLEELIISDAPQLKQVFGHGREEDLFVGAGNDIVLPKLRELKLGTLSCLTSFYEGNYHWVWPSLQELIVVECPKLMASFITDLEAKQLRVLRIGNHILLRRAIVLLQRQGLQKLKELRIENCEEVQEVFHGISGISTDRDSNLNKLNLEGLPELRVIWKGPTQISSFQNLTHIEVINCNKLMHVFSPSVARNLPRLECLDISRCKELERIIGEEDKDEEDQIISSMGHLQQPICFPNLKHIEVKDCNKLKSLFPITIVGGLPQLTTLKLGPAYQFEEVFRHENEDVGDEKKIVLQRLEFLRLEDLPRLISFCPGGYHFIFPSLSELRVMKCPNIPMSFTIDSDRCVHAKVKAKAEVQVFGREGPTHHVAERNHVMLLSNLRRLDLGELPELRCIWKGPTQDVSLQSLQNVEVWGCERLTYLFSSSLARCLVQLQRLTIRSCKGLEQIIMTEKEGGEISSEAHLQPLCFPQLTTIRIKNCEKLEYIFPISVAQDLRLLEELIISDVPQLRQVFGHGREEDLFVGDGNDIVLPELRALKLETLSCLTSFYEGNYHWVWQSLQELIVVECPKLTASFITDLEAKQLRVLRIGNHILLHRAIVLLQRQGLQKLEELRIENCEEVQEVFHGISTDRDSNLNKLNLEGLPELRVIWKGPTQISSFQNLTHIEVINCNKLMHVFSPSVARNLPRLECLDISRCKELERIIGEEDKDEEDQIISSMGHLQQPICFPNLKHIEVKDCNKLKSLFPITIAGGLPQLTTLRVKRASQFEEVFRHENEEDVRDEKKIVLQQLFYLKLKELPRLISFCPRGYHFIFPSLSDLRVMKCPNIPMSFTIDSDRSVHAKVKAKAEVQVFGREGPTHHVAERNHVMLLSNLRRLDLDELPELRCIWKGPTQHVSLQSLQNVKVWRCERMTYLFSLSLARSLVQLKILTIQNCKGLEQIITTEKEDGEISSEAHLQPLCFPKLTTLEIMDCEKLEFIFPISVAQDLRLLKELIISDAPQLKQVFGHGREDGLFVGDGNDIVLPKLSELKLKTLSSLTSFYEGNYHWVWPSLQELIVVECPKLMAFFITDLEAKLTALQKQLRVLRIGNHILLHKAVILLQRRGLQKLEELGIENCEEVQEVFHGISTDKDSDLKQLNLKDLPELRVIWKGPTEISSFQNLTYIDVINCNKLMHVFSPSVARNLLRLKWLDISGCEELERIIGEEDKDEEDQIISLKGHLQQPICFPNLERIEVKDCNKLRSLFPISIAVGLPQLYSITVESASQFEEVFRRENEEDVRDEKTIVLQELSYLTLKDLPRLISFCPGGYHFIFPSLEYLEVKGCLNISMSFTIDSDRSVHAKVKAKAETPQLAKEDMSEGSSTTQATVAPNPSYSNIDWERGSTVDTLPPYVEESPRNL